MRCQIVFQVDDHGGGEYKVADRGDDDHDDEDEEEEEDKEEEEEKQKKICCEVLKSMSDLFPYGQRPNDGETEVLLKVCCSCMR